MLPEIRLATFARPPHFGLTMSEVKHALTDAHRHHAWLNKREAELHSELAMTQREIRAWRHRIGALVEQRTLMTQEERPKAERPRERPCEPV